MMQNTSLVWRRRHGDTALMLAAQAGHAKVVRMLADKGRCCGNAALRARPLHRVLAR
jgi:hypothetical protein